MDEKIQQFEVIALFLSSKASSIRFCTLLIKRHKTSETIKYIGLSLSNFLQSFILASCEHYTPSFTSKIN